MGATLLDPLPPTTPAARRRRRPHGACGRVSWGGVFDETLRSTTPTKTHAWSTPAVRTHHPLCRDVRRRRCRLESTRPLRRPSLHPPFLRVGSSPLLPPPPPPRARELWTWASWTWATSAAWTAWPSRRPCFGVRRPWLLSPFPCAAPFCFCFLPSSLLGCSFLRCCQTECWLMLSAVSGGGAGRGRVCRGGGRGEWLALVVRSVAYRLCLLRWTLAHPVAHEPFVTDSF